ncbi:hypothetical protein VTG60DRAFT_290 [Thermothelomyces hinnuleus]
MSCIFGTATPGGGAAITQARSVAFKPKVIPWIWAHGRIGESLHQYLGLCVAPYLPPSPALCLAGYIAARQHTQHLVWQNADPETRTRRSPLSLCCPSPRRRHRFAAKEVRPWSGPSPRQQPCPPASAPVLDPRELSRGHWPMGVERPTQLLRKPGRQAQNIHAMACYVPY